MEGRVYVSSWRKTSDGYRVWVKNKPKLAAQGKTFQEADEALWDVIMSATDDGENTREYNPPPPAAAEVATFLDPPIVHVVGNESVTADPEGMFTGGYCRRCGSPNGGRTEKPLASNDVGAGDAGWAKIASRPTYGRPNCHYYSEDFLALLTPRERNRFTWRKVERPKRAKKVFYELVASSVVVRTVAVKGLPRRKDSGWRCKLCGYFRFPRYGGFDWPIHYVCATDLPDPLSSCFAIVEAREVELCMRQERWREIVGKPGTRDMISLDVGVVPLERCDPAPRMREVAAIERDLRKVPGRLALFR